MFSVVSAGLRAIRGNEMKRTLGDGAKSNQTGLPYELG
jgi:hypothetical protein